MRDETNRMIACLQDRGKLTSVHNVFLVYAKGSNYIVKSVVAVPIIQFLDFKIGKREKHGLLERVIPYSEIQRQFVWTRSHCEAFYNI